MAWAKARPLPHRSGKLGARGVDAVDGDGHRPRREVLDHRQGRPAGPRGQRQPGGDVRVRGAEGGPVEQVQRDADHGPRRASRHGLSKQRLVGVVHPEGADVELRLGRPRPCGDDSGKGSACCPCAIDRHRRTVTVATNGAYPRHGSRRASGSRTRAGRQSARVLGAAGDPAAVLPSLLAAEPDRARAHPGHRAVHHRGQPPVVPGPLRHRGHGPQADLLHDEEGGVHQPPGRLAAVLAGRLPDRSPGRRPGGDGHHQGDPGARRRRPHLP